MVQQTQDKFKVVNQETWIAKGTFEECEEFIKQTKDRKQYFKKDFVNSLRIIKDN